MLEGIRVLELSSPTSMLAGRILADLGADVIVVEPIGGAPGRRMPPFIDSHPGLERSLTWHALNRNKRSVTLDPRSADGRRLAETLLTNVDILIEDKRCQQGFENVQVPDSVVRCLIDAFASNGPKAHYSVTDRVLMAAGGSVSAAGLPDRAPLFFPLPQAIMEAGGDAAVAVLAGLAARDAGHNGQVVCVDARISATLPALSRTITGKAGGPTVQRTAHAGIGNLPFVPHFWETRSGYIVLSLLFSPAWAAMTRGIAQWLIEEGLIDSSVADMDLVAVAAAAQAGTGSAEIIEQLVTGVTAACRSKTNEEILTIARKRHFMAAPMMDMAEIAEFEHYRERGLFVPQDIGGKIVQVPARFSQFSNYEIGIRRNAPQLSEHTVEVFSEITDLTPTEFEALFAQGVI